MPLKSVTILVLAGFASLALVSVGQPAKRVVLGVLEDQPGVYADQPHFRDVRVLFEKSGGTWKSFPADCFTQNCTEDFPLAMKWTIGLHGKILGHVASRVSREFTFYSEIGMQKIISAGSVPTFGKRSEAFSGYWGEPVYRPLVANSQANFQDPRNWRPAHLSGAALAVLRRRFRQQFPHVENCRNPYESKAVPWAYQDKNIHLLDAYASSGGWMLASLELGPSRCDYSADDLAYSDWSYLVRPDGGVEVLGDGLTFLDAGDYDGDGSTEVLFQIAGDNLGGYELFYDQFRKHVSFKFGYH